MYESCGVRSFHGKVVMDVAGELEKRLLLTEVNYLVRGYYQKISNDLEKWLAN